MARSITFSGITRFTPGGITRVNAEALNQVLSSDNSIVGLIGEADGGAPGATAGLVTISDPSRATDIYKSGPLVDAIRLAFQSSNDPAIPGGASKVYVYKTNASTGSSVSLPSADLEVASSAVTGGTSTTVISSAAGITADDEHNGRWAVITDTSASETFLRKITGTDLATNTFTVNPALPFTPTTGDFIQVHANSINLQSKDWGEHTNGVSIDISTGSVSGNVVTVSFEGDEEVSTDVGGKAIFHLLYKGGATTTADSSAAGSTASVINLTTGGLSIDAEIGNQVLINGEYTEIVDNDVSSITVSPPLSAAPAASGTDNVFIQSVTAGTCSVTGAAGSATGLTTSITGVTGDNLNITFVGGQTLRQLMDVILQNSNYEVAAGQGVNPDTTYVKDLDFGSATFSVLASPEIATEGPTRDTMAIVDYLNDFSQWVSATRASDTGSTVAGGNVPIVTTSSVKLEGGARGPSINEDFQAGHDLLLTVKCNSVVPLIDQDLKHEPYNSTATVASVAAQLAGHVAFARGPGQDAAGERGGFIGFRGTKTEIIKQANALNDMDVQLVAQNPSVVNGLGSLQEMGPRMLAVMAASMRAGVQEVAEPLTHKAIRVSGITQDSSWNPTDIGDANDLIQNGVLFAEFIDGVGTRWVRDLTTWVKNDNLAYSEGSVRDAVRYVARGLRNTLQERFTGKKAKPATLGNVKDTAATYLETARQDSIIVDSTDPATGTTIKAYHNLKVISSGDVLKVNVGIFPVPGINFQLNDIYLQLPTQAA